MADLKGNMLAARKVKSLFMQVDSSGDGTLNLEEPLGIALSDGGLHIYSEF